MILSDKDIKARVLEGGMIHPFLSTQLRTLPSGHKAFSKGLSSGGYDISLDRRLAIAKYPYDPNRIIDPKSSDPSDFFTEVEAVEESPGMGYSWIIPPQTLVLGATVEYFRIPKDIMAMVHAKSTLARWGILLNVTWLEPGWDGILVVEAFNQNHYPFRLYAGEGIGQVVFHTLSSIPDRVYGDRDNNYQGQRGITYGHL